ncbi:MAG: PEGA domain-containing protein [Deltaproteobacteria bacterium]|nr:PEGA domain-containing protein [Deltaproteobacteria bacterium]
MALLIGRGTFAAAQQAEERTDARGTGAQQAEVEEARRRYAQGVAFFRADRYEEAIAEFTEAYRLWQNPTILYSLAQSNEALLRVSRAIEHYRRYLETAPADDPRREEVESTIAGLDRLLATVTIATNVRATVHLDGEEAGEAPGTIRVPTGRHEIELRADGYEPARQTVTVAGRSIRSLTFALRRRTPTRVIVREPRGLSPTWFWIGSGFTAAAAVAGGVLGALTLSAASDYDGNRFRTKAERDRGERLALLTDVTLGSALLFAATTFVIFVNTDWSGAAQRRSSTALAAPGGMTLAWSM